MGIGVLLRRRSFTPAPDSKIILKPRGRLRQEDLPGLDHRCHRLGPGNLVGVNPHGKDRDRRPVGEFLDEALARRCPWKRPCPASCASVLLKTRSALSPFSLRLRATWIA
jgi:hypothetical protein